MGNFDSYLIITFEATYMDQSEEYAPEVNAAQTRMKNNAWKFHRQYEARTANDLKESKLQKATTIYSEKEASSWLSALPLSLITGLPCIKVHSGMLYA